MKPIAKRMLDGALLAAVALASAACTTLDPMTSLPIGTPIEQARQTFGLSGEYPLPDGGRRLEIRQHRQTYMLDFDAAGRLVAKRPVLTPEVFATMKPGMTSGDVLALIGHPVDTFPVGWQQLNVWSYRFPSPEGDCVLWQVSISNPTGLVTDVGPNMDPACGGGAHVK
jgi:hypothetical protein